MRRHLFTAFLVATAASVVPQVALAAPVDRIVPKRAIGPVSLKMTPDQVKETLGEPTEIRPSDLHGGWYVWVFAGAGLEVTVPDAGVGGIWNVRTTSRRYRTKSGAGVGTGLRALKRRVRGLRCQSYGGPHPDWIACEDMKGFGKPFTQFLLRERKVFQVTVARGLAV